MIRAVAAVQQAARDTDGAAARVVGSAGELSRYSDEPSREVEGFNAGVASA